MENIGKVMLIVIQPTLALIQCAGAWGIRARGVCYHCDLLINIANSLEPDQDGQNVDPDLDQNCLTL